MKKETPSDFVALFTNNIRGVQEIHQSLVIQAFMMGLISSRLFFIIGDKAIGDHTQGLLKNQSIHSHRSDDLK